MSSKIVRYYIIKPQRTSDGTKAASFTLFAWADDRMIAVDVTFDCSCCPSGPYQFTSISATNAKMRSVV